MSTFKVFLILLVALTIAGGQFTAHAQGPSFDCAKARGTVALQICGDPDLSAKDRRMAAAYHEVLQHLAGDEAVAFRHSHFAWFKSYQASCGRVMQVSERATCIGETLDARTAQLQQPVPAPQVSSKAYSVVSACFTAGGFTAAASVVLAILIDIFTGVDIDWDDLVGTAAGNALKPCVDAAIKKMSSW